MIKIFSADDMQKCCDLFLQVFNAPPWEDGWKDDTALVYLHELADNRCFLGYTLWEGDVLTGTVLAHTKSNCSGNEIFIDELFVKQDCRRKGYGTALMNELEKFAKENGFVNITLLTGYGMPSFDFYTKHGYEPLSHLAFMYKYLINVREEA